MTDDLLIGARLEDAKRRFSGAEGEWTAGMMFDYAEALRTIEQLQELVRHCWVHTAYRDCGYLQADRLALIRDGRDRGGYCKEAVAREIRAQIAALAATKGEVRG